MTAPLFLIVADRPRLTAAFPLRLKVSQRGTVCLALCFFDAGFLRLSALSLSLSAV